MVAVLQVINGKRAMLVSLVVVVCLGSVFTPCLGKPRHPDYSYSDEGDSYVGDVLSSQQKVQNDELDSKPVELPANGQLFEGDIVMDDRLRRAVWGEKSKKSAESDLKQEGLLWPGGLIYYEVDKSFDAKHKELLRKAMHEYVTRTCIRFKKRTNQPNYVYFTQTGDGIDECSSSIGMTGGRQRITLGPHCTVLGTFEHEIMHALGFIHEHSRPDRDDYISVNYTNIKRKEYANFEKYQMDEVDNLKMDFNFASIMLYRNNAFTKNGKDTITAVTEPKLKFGQRIKFSAGDVLEINTLYNCKYYLEHPNYHGLYETYHTKKKKKDTKDITKDELERKRMLKLLVEIENKLQGDE